MYLQKISKKIFIETFVCTFLQDILLPRQVNQNCQYLLLMGYHFV